MAHFERPGCFELVKQGKPGEECAYAHLMVDCPKCKADLMGEIVPLPYRGAVVLKCESCGYELPVYVNTDTGTVGLLGPQVCTRVSEG